MELSRQGQCGTRCGEWRRMIALRHVYMLLRREKTFFKKRKSA
jgi:hypothetical protein